MFLSFIVCGWMLSGWTFYCSLFTLDFDNFPQECELIHILCFQQHLHCFTGSNVFSENCLVLPWSPFTKLRNKAFVHPAVGNCSQLKTDAHSLWKHSVLEMSGFIRPVPFAIWDSSVGNFLSQATMSSHLCCSYITA